jgi:putative SOS response-associated peptidase YedK
MCYNIKYIKQRQLKAAGRLGDGSTMAIIRKEIEEIEQKEEKNASFSDEMHLVSGFSHSKAFIAVNNGQVKSILSRWGLVPHWVKSPEQANEMANRTLNARIETIFEKPSFRDAAKSQRGILFVDGFYEHYHSKSKKYPFHVYAKDKSMLALGVLYSDCVDTETGEVINTFSIVTTVGKGIMETIHNNPKMAEPRMPLMLRNELAKKWINPSTSKEEIMDEMVIEASKIELDAHTVMALSGKKAVGNVAGASNKVDYPDLGMMFI